MTLPRIYELSREFQVKIPFDARDANSSIEELIKALNPSQQLQLLKSYGDAGKRSTYLYFCREKIPSQFQIYTKANDLVSIKHASTKLENYPYYYQAENDNDNDALRLRFHYFQDSIMIVDENNIEHEWHPKYFGVAIYRKDSHILEVRTKHKKMADKIATNTPVQLGLAPFPSIDLMDEKLVEAFVDWVRSLNSANIELYKTEEVAGSVHITARKGMDLKTTAKLTKELQDGQLQGGHVTIEHRGTQVNFRINFRDCHVTYTLFTNEPDMTNVIKAIERIMEGHYDKQSKLLKFLGKPN
ncbi:MAG: hypothetical protein M1490_05385 [Candidatus Bathyarchaeota archaeon]|nr:hypothetical protein [Candidatus Bathyarchaeota archaeon]